MSVAFCTGPDKTFSASFYEAMLSSPTVASIQKAFIHARLKQVCISLMLAKTAP
jgi:hypothetical protein